MIQPIWRSRSGLSWVLNSYNIAFAALLVPAGRLADRIGHRRVFLWGVGLFALASAACAFATSVEMLVAARVFQAAFAAANPTFPPRAFRASCYSNDELREARICLNKDLSPRACTESVGQCNATSIKVRPVR